MKDYVQLDSVIDLNTFNFLYQTNTKKDIDIYRFDSK